MIKIGLHVLGGGYGGVSIGGMEITVIRNDFYKKFSGFCQGTSGSRFFVYDAPVTNELQGYDTSVLLDLNLFDLKLEVPTPFVAYNPVEFTLQLFEANSTVPIFKASQRASAWGISLGATSILIQAAQLKLISKGSWSELQQAADKQLEKDVRHDRVVATMY